MLRIQNIVPKHFILTIKEVNENTLRRGISFINLVTRDEITNSVPSSLNFISVNNISVPTHLIYFGNRYYLLP